MGTVPSSSNGMVMREPLQKRRCRLERTLLPKLAEPVRYSAPLDADLPVLI